MFSKACEYGIKAMIFIAKAVKKQDRVSLKEIASEINSPMAFTAKILQILGREGLLVSYKGISGGFDLALPAKQITLARIVMAIDGNRVFTGCGLGLEQCNARKPCPVHYKFANVRDNLADMLETTRLDELVIGLEEGVSFLVR